MSASYSHKFIRPRLQSAVGIWPFYMPPPRVHGPDWTFKKILSVDLTQTGDFKQ